MNNIVLLGPPRYEVLMASAILMLQDHGLQVIPNLGDKLLGAGDIKPYADTCIAVIAGPEPWTGERMGMLPSLQVIAKCGAGVDNIDLDAAKERGIKVTSTPGLNSNAVAEFTVGLMICVMRGIHWAAEAMQRGERMHIPGQELTTRTVGLIGGGHIGRLVAKRLQGFDVEVLIHDPFLNEAPEDVHVVESLEELLQRSSIISLHLPATPQTEGLVDASFLGKCQAGSYIINAARGAVINEQALGDALDSGHIAGAALDVLNDESAGSVSVLHGRPNVLLTPHLGAETWDAYGAVGAANATDVIDLLAGNPSIRQVV